MLSNFYESGGWGMYPTTLFGFCLVAAGVLFLIRADRRYLPLVTSLGVITFSSGLLGCSVGFVKTFKSVSNLEHNEQLRLALVGAAESLNNLLLALVIVTFTGLLVSVAFFRGLRTPQNLASL